MTKKKNLLSEHPEIAQIWDYEKNSVDLKDIHPGSSKKAWFRCGKGHSYKRAVYIQTAGAECPECKAIRLSVDNKKYISDFWDTVKNRDIDICHTYAHYNTIVHWKCPKCGYEWKSQVRARKTEMCPACDLGTAIKKGVNDVFTVVPALKEDFIQELNPGIDMTKIGTGNKTLKIHWKCHVCGYEWKSTVFARTRNHKGENRISSCPVCSKAKRAISFAEQYPDLTERYSEDNPLPFHQIPGDYQADYLWECPEHGTYPQKLSAMIRARDSQYHGCPFCANKILSSHNSLKKNFPELYKELAFEENYILLETETHDVSIHSRTSVWWKCQKCGCLYPMTPYDRVSLYNRQIEPCNHCKGIRGKISHYLKEEKYVRKEN